MTIERLSCGQEATPTAIVVPEPAIIHPNIEVTSIPEDWFNKAEPFWQKTIDNYQSFYHNFPLDFPSLDNLRKARIITITPQESNIPNHYLAYLAEENSLNLAHATTLISSKFELPLTKKGLEKMCNTCLTDLLTTPYWGLSFPGPRIDSDIQRVYPDQIAKWKFFTNPYFWEKPFCIPEFLETLKAEFPQAARFSFPLFESHIGVDINEQFFQPK
ncbi:hypothetical protein COT75_04260 [Candidatus Beckwithbacteria bacterium CG10_big_fil_rev_8_21_14_0_10_34_10]|uniref:Uncharacterized protein n=1 Tax=Candidatus Beckwithbacteria bacterium CG10_big_fil_rev_8_21_14_0_10_34_10 TaxID=1974495 RepID=A0A2H0W8E8_9BACT|nr:MAG: hypothetical protein COT75_04260 [Candidatus Beckwithbacteria bacterium CG10_big_fil_rev_8_21_14_0_10_34_10]